MTKVVLVPTSTQKHEKQTKNTTTVYYVGKRVLLFSMLSLSLFIWRNRSLPPPLPPARALSSFVVVFFSWWLESASFFLLLETRALLSFLPSTLSLSPSSFAPSEEEKASSMHLYWRWEQKRGEERKKKERRKQER